MSGGGLLELLAAGFGAQVVSWITVTWITADTQGYAWLSSDRLPHVEVVFEDLLDLV